MDLVLAKKKKSKKKYDILDRIMPSQQTKSQTEHSAIGG